jgi:hypothetical protein
MCPAYYYVRLLADRAIGQMPVRTRMGEPERLADGRYRRRSDKSTRCEPPIKVVIYDANTLKVQRLEQDQLRGRHQSLRWERWVLRMAVLLVSGLVIWTPRRHRGAKGYYMKLLLIP